jgi:hypothetical protein
MKVVLSRNGVLAQDCQNNLMFARPRIYYNKFDEMDNDVSLF